MLKNAFSSLKQMVRGKRMNSEIAVHTLIATVLGECCQKCHEKFHSPEFLKAYEHMIDEMRLVDSLSKRNIAA